MSARAGAATSSDTSASAQASRRRSFAVISHPDAGKSTLTEALALHARVISEAGAVHGKAGRQGVVSDWMEMERARGISITSAALQFAYGDAVVNLLDTPGHADFSEDTYRVLSAVDSAVMLLDAAKGLEPQTLKLFDVCRHRGIPVITFINKWDRPGREALELCDELTERIGLTPMPLTWPVGEAGRFRGVLDVSDGAFVAFERTAGGATVAGESRVPAEQAAAELGEDFTRATEELELVAASGGEFDVDAYLDGSATPVLFGAAVLNFGVRHLLDLLVELAPRPEPRVDVEGKPRPPSSPRSCSRCRPAWIRRTATRSRSRASARGCSSAAWWSRTPRRNARSPRSTPTRSSGNSVPLWTLRIPVT
jgi:peptide chain release factor 3